MNGQSNGPRQRRRAEPPLIALVAVALVLFYAGRSYAAPAPGTVNVRIQFEGYIRDQAAGRWRINDVYLQVDRSTIVDETAALAVPYAYVIVNATHLDGRPMRADTITVVRAASNAGPKLEISGTLVKQGLPENGLADWSISGTLVEVTAVTAIVGQPVEGCMLTALAEDRAGVLYALQIQVVAESATSVPVEFEGVVGRVDPAAHSWVVDDSTVYYDEATKLLNGMPAVGQTVDVRAGLSGDGRLLASLVHIENALARGGLSTSKPGGAPGGQPSGLAPGTPQTFLSGGFPLTRTRSREGAAAGRGAAYPAAIQSDLRAAAWSSPVAIAANQNYAATPVLVYMSDGAANAVWEDQGTLVHAVRPPGGQWSLPARVAVGVMPSIVVGPDDTLHLLFSHDFIGNEEIYYVNYRDGHWSLPINVSHTSGSSVRPAAGISPSGTLYATWQDSMPDDWVIYYGQLENNFWSSRPVPNARGEDPGMAVRPDGQIYVDWQAPIDATDAADTDVYVAQSLPAHQWTLPVNVSDSPGSRSAGSSIVSPDGLAHVAWLENNGDVYFSFGSGLTWSVPQPVASANLSAEDVRLTTFASQLLFLSWIQDGTSIRGTYQLARSGDWADPVAIAELPSVDRRDLAISSQPGGEISVAWVEPSAEAPGLLSLYESTHPSIVQPRNWLPLLLQK